MARIICGIGQRRVWVRSVVGITSVLAIGVVLSGCSTTRFGSSSQSSRAVEQLRPVNSSTVQSQALPPLGGTDGQVATINDSDNFGSGDPVLLDPADPNRQANGSQANGSFVSLNDLGAEPNTSGRDLSGGVTIAKMLGSWTVISGADRCRLNLTQTTKSGTNRYRASTPGCQIEALAGVTSWQLAGTQLQLYDDNGAIIGSFLKSGNRFIGTMVGGISVSMVG